MTKIYGTNGQPVTDNDAMAAVAATATTQDAIDVLVERLNYWRSKAIAEAGEVEAMEQAYQALQIEHETLKRSGGAIVDMLHNWQRRADAQEALAKRNAAACAHWQSVALERKSERDSVRAMAAMYQRSRDGHSDAGAKMARRITELEAERSELRSATWGMAGRVAELERENGELQQRLAEHERRLCVVCGSREGELLQRLGENRRDFVLVDINNGRYAVPTLAADALALERSAHKAELVRLDANANRLHEAANASAAKAQRFYEMFRNEQKANRARLRELIKRKRGQVGGLKGQLAKAQREIEALKATNEQLWHKCRNLEDRPNGNQIKEQTVLGYSLFVDSFGNEYVTMAEHRRVLSELRAANERAQVLVNQIEREEAQTKIDHEEMAQRIDALRRANETLVAALRNSDAERDAIKHERDALQQDNNQVVDIDQGMLDTMLALYGSLGATIEKFVELYQQIETEPSNE